MCTQNWILIWVENFFTIYTSSKWFFIRLTSVVKTSSWNNGKDVFKVLCGTLLYYDDMSKEPFFLLLFIIFLYSFQATLHPLCCGCLAVVILMLWHLHRATLTLLYTTISCCNYNTADPQMQQHFISDKKIFSGICWLIECWAEFIGREEMQWLSWYAAALYAATSRSAAYKTCLTMWWQRITKNIKYQLNNEMYHLWKYRL